MMLRVSTQSDDAVDLKAITQGNAVTAGVPGDKQLIDLVEAALNNPDALPAARQAVVDELGAEELVDAAAVIGNFQRMVRMADGTGIPLDEPVAVMTADLREEIGVNDFGSAAETPRVGFVKRMLGRYLGPTLIRRMVRR